MAPPGVPRRPGNDAQTASRPQRHSTRGARQTQEGESQAGRVPPYSPRMCFRETCTAFISRDPSSTFRRPFCPKHCDKESRRALPASVRPTSARSALPPVGCGLIDRSSERAQARVDRANVKPTAGKVLIAVATDAIMISARAAR